MSDDNETEMMTFTSSDRPDLSDEQLEQLAAVPAIAAGAEIRRLIPIDKLYHVEVDGNGRAQRALAPWEPMRSAADRHLLLTTLKMTLAHEPSRGGWSVGAVVDGEFQWLAFHGDEALAIVWASAAIGEPTLRPVRMRDIAKLADRLGPMLDAGTSRPAAQVENVPAAAAGAPCEREQLAFAAKAMGLEVTWEGAPHNCYWVAFGQGLTIEPWEPKDNDTQALWLQAALVLRIQHRPSHPSPVVEVVREWGPVGEPPISASVPYGGSDVKDVARAIRLAIFLAAVEIGKAMP